MPSSDQQHEWEAVQPVGLYETNYTCKNCFAVMQDSPDRPEPLIRHATFPNAPSNASAPVTIDDIYAWAEGVQGALGTEHAHRITNEEAILAQSITNTKQLMNALSAA